LLRAAIPVILYAAVRWKVVPTLLWMNVLDRRRAIMWVAFQPVQ